MGEGSVPAFCNPAAISAVVDAVCAPALSCTVSLGGGCRGASTDGSVGAFRVAALSASCATACAGGQVSAHCNPSISFWMFFLPSGSSMPPAMEASLPNTPASPCHAIRVLPSTGVRSNPAAMLIWLPTALPWPLYCARGWPHRLGQFHLDFRRAANVAHADAHLHREVGRVLHRHALEIGKQWGELIGIAEEVENFVWRTRRGELARECDSQRLAPRPCSSGRLNCFENVLIPSTAASVAGDAFANFCFGGMRMLTQQLQRAH